MVLNFNYHKDMLGRNMKARTLDNKYSQRNLIEHIKALCIEYSPNNDGKALYEQIIPSFSKEGILETYNELGADVWEEMILGIINKEIKEQAK